MFFIIFWYVVLHFGGSIRMENTPTECGGDLPPMLWISTNDLKLEKGNPFSPAAGFGAGQYKQGFVHQPKLHPAAYQKASFDSPSERHSAAHAASRCYCMWGYSFPGILHPFLNDGCLKITLFAHLKKMYWATSEVCCKFGVIVKVLNNNVHGNALHSGCGILSHFGTYLFE